MSCARGPQAGLREAAASRVATRTTSDQVSFTFPHERLDVFHVAVELAEVSRGVADRIPRGYRRLADQLQRSGTAPALLIAEGANRRARGDKRQRFSEANGEAGEAAATVTVGLRLGVVSEQDGMAVRRLAARVAAMSTRLVRRFS